MQNASKLYKESMKSICRNRSYIKATIGVINSKAQENVVLNPATNITYFSNPTKPFENYTVDNVYATCEEDFSKVDGSMYFLPQEDSGMEYYNNGIVTNDLLGSIYIAFRGVVGLDIKGLTINWGEYYPTEFTVSNGAITRSYTNSKSYWNTEDVFDNTSELIIVPISMKNGNGRLRIQQFFCGIVNAFTNKEVKSFSSKEYVSSITDTIPSNDITLVVDNQNQYYNPDNPESTLAYLEVGQEVQIQFGYDVDGNGNIEWLPTQTTYLKSWSATDTEAKFTATDRFDYLTTTYYKGKYRQDGVSLYDLAIDVLHDAGITDEREYFIDPYLNDIIVYNPIPPVKHSEALQIIANAGRCVLFEDRQSRIHIQSSFIPDMTIETNGETEYSHIANVLDASKKDAYAITSNDFTLLSDNTLFMPNTGFLHTGYISDAVSDENGLFGANPSVTITLEAGYVCYGLSIMFRNVFPSEFTIKTYYASALVDEREILNEDLTYMTNEQFDLFDKMEIIFTKGHPNSRITIDSILLGDFTDYRISRDDMTGSPTTNRKDKIQSITVDRKQYKQSTELKDLQSEELVASPTNNVFTGYFTNASYGYTVALEDAPSGVTASVIDSSDYFVTIQINGLTTEQTIRYSIKGYEYLVEENKYVKQHGHNGVPITWSNPLVSSYELAKDIEEFLASYYLGDVEYQIKWRGDPRTDANDLFFMQLKDREDVAIRCYQNELKFNGGLSGTMKARKVVL